MAKAEEEDENHKTKEEISAKPKPQSSTDQISKRPKSTTGKNTSESKTSHKQPKAESQNAEQDQQPSHRSLRATTCYSSATIASCAKRMLNVSQTLKQQSQGNLDGSIEQSIVNVNNISFKNTSPQLVASKFKYSQGSAFSGGSAKNINSIMFQDVLSDNESQENRKRTPVSFDQINPQSPPQLPQVRTTSADSNQNSDCGASVSLLLPKECKHSGGDENNNVQYDTVGMAVSTFRTKNMSQNLDIDNEQGLSSRTTTLTPNSAHRQVQLVLKRVCLLDPNMQERKVISNAQRMIQQRTQTAASSSVRITDISRPSTSSNVTTLSMDGKLLGDEQQPEKLSTRSGMSGLEGYMNSYYRDKTTGNSFQIGDLLPAVDDHNNKITRLRRGNSTPNERSNSIPGDPSSQTTQSTLLQNEDKIFMAKEGIELIRLKERQQSVSRKAKL